ncbi:hypothetical protein ACFLZW_06535, partial [Chloroflexota bacterium]
PHMNRSPSIVHLNTLKNKIDNIKTSFLHDKWPQYKIFGLNMSSDYPFGDRFPSGHGGTDLIFTCLPAAPVSIPWDEIEAVYTSIYRTKDNKPAWYLYQFNGFYFIRYTDTADFYIEGQTIACHILDKQLEDTNTMNLLPTVLALWLEFRGIPCLHASAVVVNDHAVAFLANSGQGKSTIAASFLQAGYPLLTDDKLPLEQQNGEFMGRPGFPLIRIFPEVAEHFLGGNQGLDVVMPGFPKRVAHVEHDAFGRFCHSPRPLACIYLLERGDTETPLHKTMFTPVSPRDAVIELIRFDFTTRVNEVLGFSADRLEFFSQLARCIPVRRITYPNGHEYLPEVCDAILRNLQQIE